MPLHIGRRSAMAAAFSLAACSEARTYRPAEMRTNYRYDPVRGEAILLGSFETFSAKPGIASTLLSAQPAKCFLEIKRVVQTGERVTTSGEQRRNHVSGGADLEEYADQVSGLKSSTVLFCMVVPAARYRIDDVLLDNGSTGIYSASRRTKFSPIEFDAKAGVARYIGNYIFGYGSQLRISHMALRDMSERDLPRLRNEVPWLASVSPVIDIPERAGLPANLPTEIS